MGKSLNGKELGVGISQRKDGLYQGRYVDAFGKRKTIYYAKLAELRKELAIQEGLNAVGRSVTEEVKLDDWFAYWVDVYKKKQVRPNTLREYTHIYNKNISPHIGQRNISSLRKSNIQKLIDIAADDGYEYERQNKIKVILSDMLQRAVEDEYLVTNPVSGIMLRADKIIKAVALSLDQQDTFLDYARNTFYENAYHVMLNTGMRPGELYALYVDDIHLDDGYIDINKTLVYQKYLTDSGKTFHIEPPKTKTSVRKIPINSVCRRYLERQLELKQIVSQKRPKEQNDFIFVTKFNTPLNVQIFGDSIRRIVRSINLMRGTDDKFAYFTPHTFRHTFATRCLEAGVEPKTIQQYLGHASLKMTMDLYVHITDEKARIDIEKIVPATDKKIVQFETKVV